VTVPLESDIAIVGAGFGGSLLAMIGRRLGLRVALLERGTHPRFAIGESASPLAGVVIEQLARRYDLPRLAPLAAYGTWRQRYPDVTCGLKRGFTYYRHEDHRAFAQRHDRANELLVAASPNDELSDTHWLRSDVDQFLVQEAVALGADYVDQLQLDAIEWRANDVVLNGRRRGAPVRVAAGFVVDASGPRGFLSRVVPVAAQAFDAYPGTQALYSHFTGVTRCADLPEFMTHEKPPYPIDAAALHHVFDQGWMWVLRFDNGVTSAGVAVTDALAAELRLADGEPAWHRLLARYPTVAAQFAHAVPIREFTWMPRIAWRASAASGDRWAMLPSAAAFVDPLFSTGIPLTLLGVERLARRMADVGRGPSALPDRTPDVGRCWSASPDRTPDVGRGWSASPERTPDVRRGWSVSPDRRPDVGRGLSASPERTPHVGRGLSASPDYSNTVLAEADHVARFVAGCYAAFPRFDAFAAWSMFYFAAASFSEMSRRLSGDGWSRGFLLANDEALTTAMAALRPVAAGTASRGPSNAGAIAAAIDPINVAGLADPEKRNWYGVDVEDTVRAADKLGAAPEAVRGLFTASA
jgi:flavin-dependent dehydrogenase